MDISFLSVFRHDFFKFSTKNFMQVGERTYRASTKQGDQTIQQYIQLKVPTRLLRDQMVEDGVMDRSCNTTKLGRQAATSKVFR